MTHTIGIIGAGQSGGALARLAVAAGYRVVLSNSRGPQTLTDLAGRLGPRASAATVDEAIAAGDVVAIAVPLASLHTVPADRLAGKIVIDQTNYYPVDGDFRRADLDAAELTSSELVQRHLRDARVVKAFHNIDTHHLPLNARPAGHPERTTLPVAGDDEVAKDVVTRFAEAAGYDVVDAGSLAGSWRVEPNTPIYFWPYAPTIPDGLTKDQAKAFYLANAGAPLSREAARTLIDQAVRPSPPGGTLAGLPPAQVALFLDHASANTVRR